MSKHLSEKYGYNVSKETYDWIYDNIYNLEVMPSMRAMMTAGPALERNHIAAFNCTYTPVNDIFTFSEVLIILLCGSGVGFSVEDKYISQLPPVPEELWVTEEPIIVEDSKEGWAKALDMYLRTLWLGWDCPVDYSQIRPAGARLKTFGGRASGPQPLMDLFNLIHRTFHRAQGRQLTRLEVHDIMTKIGDAVVSGGVRRSAMISLSDLNDPELREAKSGDWYNHSIHRALANNSAVYEQNPDVGTFLDEWSALYKSGSGERGIFSRDACKKHVASLDTRDEDYEWGCNPCSEIVLRPKQMCNLSEVVCRPGDRYSRLREEVQIASTLGTWQSTLTDFKYIRNNWRENCEEERLLGVSLTGVMDHEVLNGTQDTDKLKQWLSHLRQDAREMNRVWADNLGINESAAITCNKPSGTVSALVGASSGIHPAHADYYIRRVRSDKHDPIAQFLIDQGIPYEEDQMKSTNWVFSFPMKSPATSIKGHQLSATQHLEIWKLYQQYYTEHKPSVTISIAPDEWTEVADWVYKNFDYMSGVSFLPTMDTVYPQMPFEACSEENYKELLAKIPKTIDWSKLSWYESTDHTAASQEFACTGGQCNL